MSIVIFIMFLPLIIFFLFLIFVVFVFLTWKRHSPTRKKLLLFMIFTPAVLFFSLFLLAIKPEFPVEYDDGCGVDDYINGNCINYSLFGSFFKTHLYGWKDYTKEQWPPLVTEDDRIIDAIDHDKQESIWRVSYSKEDLLRTAQDELKNAQYNQLWRQADRIQSFIDILSKRSVRISDQSALGY